MPQYLNWKRLFKGGEKESKSGGKGSLRRYYIIAGTYLLVVVVAFSVLVLRWGTAPQLELPGFEGTGQQQSGEQEPALELPGDTEEKDSGSARLVQTGEQPPKPDRDSVALSNESGDPGPADESGDDPGDKQAELTELPLAANPLPRFEVALPFGNYLSASIPSGGAVHHLSRGVLLRTTPAAPVTALWDGVVTQVKVMHGLYRCSVLIEHRDHIGEYSTFYGNLREVWVKEGTLVSRGENIGLMAYHNGREEQLQYEGSLPVSGRPVSGEGQSLEMRTLYSGYLGDVAEGATEKAPSVAEEMAPALLPLGEDVEGFPPGNPLFYLEVRQKGTFVDPLNFITAGN